MLSAALKRAARGGWFVLFVVALMVASLPPRLAPVVSGAPAAVSSSAPFVAVIPHIGLADLATGPRAVSQAAHEWKSRKLDRRVMALADGAALASSAAGPPAGFMQDRPRERLRAATVRHLAFRHFDARGPPAIG